MQDTKLFETILGITAPWHVARVELKPADQRVDLWLEHEPIAAQALAARHPPGRRRFCIWITTSTNSRTTRHPGYAIS
jgi:hypothetical protein